MNEVVPNNGPANRYSVRFLFAIVVSGLVSWAFYAVLAGTPAQQSSLRQVMDSIMKPGRSYDIVVVGNSRIRMHVNPRILDSMLGSDSFVLGADACSIPQSLMMMRVYLRSHKAPRCVVVLADYSNIQTWSDPHNFDEYVTYFDDSLIYATLEPYVHHPLPRILGPWYQFQRLAAAPDEQKLPVVFGLVGGGNMGMVGSREQAYKGFAGMKRTWSPWRLAKPRGARIDTAGLMLLRTFIDECRARGTNVVVVCPPIHRLRETHVRGYRVVVDRIAAFVAANGVPYLDYTRDPITDRKDLFFNVEHLNAAGADVFSRLLAHDIRPWLEIRGSQPSR